MDAAPLIVRARVVKGGTFGAIVRVEHSYKGQAPDGDLHLVRFNRLGLSPETQRAEGLQVGDTLWAALQAYEADPDPRALRPWEAEGLDTPAGRTFEPLDPLTGKVVARDGTAHANLLAARLGPLGPGQPAERWERILSALVARRADGAVPAVSEADRRCLAQVQATPTPPERESDVVQCLAGLALLGLDRWDPRLAAFQGHADPRVRGALGLVAAPLEDPSALQSWLLAVLDSDPRTSAPAADAAIDASPEDRTRLAAALVERLPRSRTATGAELTADLVALRDDDRRRQVLGLIGELGAGPFIEPLRAEIRFSNPAVLYELILVLERAAPGCWSADVGPVLADPDGRRFKAWTEAVELSAAPAARPLLLEVLARPDLPPEAERLVLSALEKVGDAQAASRVRDLVTPLVVGRTTWPDEVRDRVAFQLGALATLEGADALDLAWLIAATYLGWPREVADPDVLAALEARRAAAEQQVRSLLPEGSRVHVRLVAATPERLGRKKPGAVDLWVDADVPDGLRDDHREAVAEALGLPLDAVQVCGRSAPGTRWGCDATLHAVWREHQTLTWPVLRIVHAAAQRGDAEAAAWLRAIRQSGLLERSDTRGLLDHLDD